MSSPCDLSCCRVDSPWSAGALWSGGGGLVSAPAGLWLWSGLAWWWRSAAGLSL